MWDRHGDNNLCDNSEVKFKSIYLIKTFTMCCSPVSQPVQLLMLGGWMERHSTRFLKVIPIEYFPLTPLMQQKHPVVLSATLNLLAVFHILLLITIGRITQCVQYADMHNMSVPCSFLFITALIYLFCF